jgi:hypothetical protein
VRQAEVLTQAVAETAVYGWYGRAARLRFLARRSSPARRGNDGGRAGMGRRLTRMATRAGRAIPFLAGVPLPAWDGEWRATGPESTGRK